MQSKLHNRTLFVAALSVYLGLLIVGAPPHVLAQPGSSATTAPAIRSEQDERVIREKMNSVRARLMVLLESGKLDDYHVSFTFDGKVEPQIFVRKGDLQLAGVVADYLEAVRAGHPFESGSMLKLSGELKANNTEFVNNFTLTTKSADDAQMFATGFNVFIKVIREQKESSSTKLFLENTTVNFDDKQIFIVIRLPRGSLDRLLKADERAD